MVRHVASVDKLVRCWWERTAESKSRNGPGGERKSADGCWWQWGSVGGQQSWAEVLEGFGKSADGCWWQGREPERSAKLSQTAGRVLVAGGRATDDCWWQERECERLAKLSRTAGRVLVAGERALMAVDDREESVRGQQSWAEEREGSWGREEECRWLLMTDSAESMRDQQSWAEEQQGPQQQKGPFDGCWGQWERWWDHSSIGLYF